MLRKFLLGKIHNARVTDTNKDYEGSIEVDPDIYEKAGMQAGEIVAVFDIDNGKRFETYIIKGEKGARRISLNGAAARKVLPGDKLIILTYCYVEDTPPKPKIIVLGEGNVIVDEK